jgi:hypothetical protein
VSELVELTYRRGGAVVLPDGREANSEFAAARMLIADGCDPATPVQSRWPGSPYPSLSGTLGGWARLEVREQPRMRFAEYHPREPYAEPATRRFGEGAVPENSGETPKAAGGAHTPVSAPPASNGAAWSTTP